MPSSESNTVNAIRNGDAEALRKVMDTYSNQLMRTAYIVLKDTKLAEDVTQETFIKFYYAIDGFRGDSSIKTYLNRILLNQCRQKMRKNWFKRVFTEFRGNEPEQYYMEAMENSDKKLDLQRCLMQLDNKYREVILLYYYNDLSVREISQISGQAEGTVKSRLKRAREKLRKIAGEEFFYERQDSF